MAHTKTLQFYRNNTVVRPDTNNNKSALTVARESLDTNGSKNDGEITLVRYQEGDDDPVKTLAGIYRKNGNTGTWTYLTEFDYENYYTKDEIDDNEFVVAQAISDLSEEISEKQDELTSGINIKTINYTSVLGHGNISVQPTLVSGTNIKTINNNSLLGAGNVDLTASDVGAMSTSHPANDITSADITAWNGKADRAFIHMTESNGTLTFTDESGTTLTHAQVHSFFDNNGLGGVYIQYNNSIYLLYGIETQSANQTRYFFYTTANENGEYGYLCLNWYNNSFGIEEDYVTTPVPSSRQINSKSLSSNITLNNVDFGQGYATCTTIASATAKTASLANYVLMTGGIVSVKFDEDVPASSTLNINGTGAKSIYNKGAAIAAGVINGGDTVTFMYDGTRYQLLSIDRWQDKQDALVSGTNIKTINSQSLLGSGDLELTASDVGAVTYEDLSDYAPLRTDDRVDYAYMPHFVLDGINKTEPSNASTASWNVAHTTNNQIAVRFQESTDQGITFGFYHYTPSQYVTYFNKEDYKFYRWTGSAMVAISSTAAYTGSYNDLTDKPTIPAAVTVDSSITSGGTNPVEGGAIYTALEDKADKVTIVTVSTTGAVTQALDPNKFYQFTGSPTSLTLTLTSGNGLCIYAGKFTAGTGFSNFSVPSTVKVADGAPTVEAGNTYEFSIMDNLLLLVKEGS